MPAPDHAARACVFCGQVGSLTKEHVYPRWIWRTFREGAPQPQGYVPGEPLAWTEELGLGAGGVPEHWYMPRDERPFINATSRMVKVVCSSCNNGWMSALEADVRALLLRISRKSQWRFTKDEIRTLRRWLVKTGLMLESFDPASRIAGPDVYAAVYGNEEPAGTWYFGLARVVREYAFEAGLTPLQQRRISVDPEGLSEGPSNEIYATQYRIAVNGFLFIVRYSPYPWIAPARIDHDLRNYPRGRPYSLTASSAGAKVQRNALPLMVSRNMDDLDMWGHATRERAAFGLVDNGDAKQVVLVSLWDQSMNDAGANGTL